jgi:hypothetical protein
MTLAQRFAIAYPKTDKELGFHLQEAGTLLPTQRAVYAAFLTALTGVALLVLCVAGSNVANLTASSILLKAALVAVPLALGVLFGLASWTVLKEKTSARNWAVVACMMPVSSLSD